MVQSVPPIFIKDSAIGVPSFTPYDMCSAVIRATNASSSLEGVQKINGLWRLYFKDRTTRLQLCNKQQLLINGVNVPLHDSNPYTSGLSVVHSLNGAHTPSNDKLTIRDIPLSVSNDAIKQMLEEKGVKLVSSMKYGLIRDQNGQLTTYKSGDRFVYIKPFDAPLPKKQKVGNFPCTVIYHGKDATCKACNEKGHKVGDPHCKAKPIEDILAFRSYEHCLSNHFPCHLHVFGEDFASVEHAYFWHMAKEFCKDDLAKEIKNSKHAGQAKRLSKQIADDEGRWEWERDHIDVMKTLLAAKADQCIQFHDCLIEHKEKLLAEANPGTFWASGLSSYVTEHCSPQFWPGQNMLGVLLTELTQTLLMKEEEVNNVTENSESSGDEDEVTENEENDEDTGDSEEMRNKMENTKMEVAGQETTDSQEIAINQELRETLKSAESLVCEVSHVPVLSEETTSTQNNDNKVKVGHSDDHVSDPHSYRPSTTQNLCNIQSLSTAKHSQETSKKDITMKDGKKKKKKKKEQILTSQQTSQSASQSGSQSASRSSSQSASKPDSQLDSQSIRHSNIQSSSTSTIQLASQSTNQSLSAGSNEQSTGESSGESTEVSPACYAEVSTGGFTGGLSVSRSRQKQPTTPAFRGPRSYSTPRRTKAMTDSAHDIGSYFDRTKRKEFASSPDEKDCGQGKMLKSDSADSVGS